MTANRNEIMSLYRQSDSGTQLAMYLQFRELRDDFIEIDQAGTDRPAAIGSHDSLCACEET